MKALRRATLAAMTLLSACSAPETAPPQALAVDQATTQPMLAHDVFATDGNFFVGTADRRFGITMPARFPRPTVQQQAGEELEVTMHMARGEDGRIAMFGWNYYPELDLTGVTADYLLTQAVTEARKQMEGRATDHLALAMNGIKGARVYVAAQQDGRPLVARYDYWVIEPYLFQIGYMTPYAQELDSQEIEDFFNSFRFGRHRAAQAETSEPEVPILF